MTPKNTLKKRFMTLTALSLSMLLANSCEKSNENTISLANESADSRAKNVILFIGDGMGISTVTAARIFDGQSQGKLGEEHQLEFERFSNVALVKTYNLDAQVPDSAGTATAILSGYKANIGTLNVKPKNLFGGCGDTVGLPTLSEIASGAGKSVGVISTARITHATPAAMYSRSASRDWESDGDIEGEAAENDCKSIAAQLVDANTPVNVVLGGGIKEFSDEQLAAWSEQGSNHQLVRSKQELTALAASDRQDVLGLFKGSHLSFEADRKPDLEPSLAEMTAFAIENLAARDTGYVLMVEAGRVDHAHHGSNAYKALRDMQALNEAVKTALAKTGEDTLIMVTADHSHVFTMAGYPKRGNPILGLVVPPGDGAKDGESPYTLAKDGKPYTTLGYHNGTNTRTADSPALTDNMVQAPEYRQQSAVPTRSETHAGEDVPLYATGPGSQKVRGVIEQNRIHHIMIDALGISQAKN